MLAVVNELGAVGDGVTDCTAAIQKDIDAAAASGGGMVYVPAGNYVTGTLWMRTNITLSSRSRRHAAGCQDVDAFPECRQQMGRPRRQNSAPLLICGEGLENVAIIRPRHDRRPREDVVEAAQAVEKPAWIMRPRLIRLVDCRNVLIEGVTLHQLAVVDDQSRRVRQRHHQQSHRRQPADSPNTDGINPDSCRNVHISDCHIDVGDDCITIKSGTEEEPRRSTGRARTSRSPTAR